MDVLTPEQRHRNMSRIRGRDTRPEMVIRRGLHARGFRYRLHVRGLPGTPDLVFPSRKAVIFVHGCFWHGHACRLSRPPATRAAFWGAKIASNKRRDFENAERLKSLGWRRIVVWECALRGPGRMPHDEILQRISDALQGSDDETVVAGN